VPEITSDGMLVIAYAGDGDQELVSISYLGGDDIAADDDDHWTFGAQIYSEDGDAGDTVIEDVNTSSDELDGLETLVATEFDLETTRIPSGSSVLFSIAANASVDPITGGGVLVVTLKRASTY